MTTQQSVVVGVCGAERSQVLVKSLVRTASRGEPLFRSSRPDYIETLFLLFGCGISVRLFRSSRPDYIETIMGGAEGWPGVSLFRSSRPDYIETRLLALAPQR